MMTKGNILFELKNSLSELDTLDQKLRQFVKRLGLTEKCYHEINLVLEELFTNIISYGYTDTAEHLIKIAISHESGTLVILIEDDGVPFNPLDAKDLDLECPLEKRRTGGLGIHLTKTLVDDMVHRRCGNRNILTLKKRLAEPCSHS
jgi:anti-sigma regulatory factor (Ser/Thr protein kinase)